jgi:phenylacetate-CoA ligase
MSPETGVVEVLNDNHIPVSLGTEGRVTVTNLLNYAMPFIRYDIGDIGILVDRDCPCGRGLPMMEAIRGRTTDVIIRKDGNIIPGLSLHYSFLAPMGLEQIQIVQETREDLVVYIVMDGQYSCDHLDTIERKIKTQFCNILGEGIVVEVRFVDRIPATREGKRLVIVSKLPEVINQNT